MVCCACRQELTSLRTMVLNSEASWQQQLQHDRAVARKVTAGKRHRNRAMTVHDGNTDADTSDITWIEMLALLQNNGSSDIKKAVSQPQQMLTRTTHIETTVHTTVAVTGGDSSTQQQQLVGSDDRTHDGDRHGDTSSKQMLSDVQQQYQYASAASTMSSAAPFSGQDLTTIARQVTTPTFTLDCVTCLDSIAHTTSTTDLNPYCLVLLVL
jgi:hypothetical protein